MVIRVLAALLGVWATRQTGGPPGVAVRRKYQPCCNLGITPAATCTRQQHVCAALQLSIGRVLYRKSAGVSEGKTP